MAEQNISGFPITADGSRRGKLVGILTRRDLKFLEKYLEGKDLTAIAVKDVMTSENLVTAAPDAWSRTQSR